MIWNFLARLAVPDRAIRRAWPAPRWTLFWFDYQVRQILIPTITNQIYSQEPLLRRLQEGLASASS